MRFLSLFLFLLSFAYSNTLEKVTIQLQWKHQFEFAGFYAAKEKGFYKDVGLDIEFKEFTTQTNIVHDVLNKKVQFAVSYSGIIADYLNGKDIVFLANFFKHSPLSIVTKPHIKHPVNLINKRVMGVNDSIDNSTIQMMFKKFAVKSIDIIDIEPTFNINDFIENKVDAMTIYTTNETYFLDKKHIKYNLLNPINYGIDFYDMNLFTSKDELIKNPKRVRNFTEASIKGWKYALNHKEEIINLILKKYNTQNKTKEALLYEANAIENIMLPNVYPIGSIDESRVKNIAEIFKELGFITNSNFNLKNFLYKSNHSILTNEEQDYLNKKNLITLCVNPNWMPFEKLDSKGIYDGISSDYYKVIEDKLSINFNIIPTNSWSQSLKYIKNKKCDVLSLAMFTKKRKEYLNFTTPLFILPLVVATKLDVPFINDVKDLQGKKIGIPKDYAFVDILKEKYNFLNIIEVEDIDDGLNQVSDGQLFGYLGTFATIGYKFQTKYYGEIKIAGKLEEDLQLSIGVRNDDLVLLNILQKTINNFSEQTKREILNKWMSIKYEKTIDYSLIWKIVLFFSILVIINIFWNRKLHNLQKKFKQLAITDKLTNLYNRHKLDEILNSQKINTDLYNMNFGIIILDIDYFKCINDEFGHNIGDKVLKEFSALLKNNSRETDIIGRWGGEEFMIIVLQTTQKSLITFSTHLKEKIYEHDFKIGKKITTSIGTTLYKKGEKIDDTINRADNALYKSKGLGRNSVNYL